MIDILKIHRDEFDKIHITTMFYLIYKSTTIVKVEFVNSVKNINVLKTNGGSIYKLR